MSHDLEAIYRALAGCPTCEDHQRWPDLSRVYLDRESGRSYFRCWPPGGLRYHCRICHDMVVNPTTHGWSHRYRGEF